MRALVAGAALLLTTSNAWSFNADGYRAGMSVSAAQQIAGKTGTRLLLDSRNGRLEGYMGRRGSEGELVGTFWFCDGRLISYENLDVAGGFPAFARVVDRETR